MRLVVTHGGLGDDERVSASAGLRTYLDILDDELSGWPPRGF